MIFRPFVTESIIENGNNKPEEGTSTETLEDGTIRERFKDGTVKERSPDGTIKEIDKDGNVKTYVEDEHGVYKPKDENVENQNNGA